MHSDQVHICIIKKIYAARRQKLVANLLMWRHLQPLPMARVLMITWNSTWWYIGCLININLFKGWKHEQVVLNRWFINWTRNRDSFYRSWFQNHKCETKNQQFHAGTRTIRTSTLHDHELVLSLVIWQCHLGLTIGVFWIIIVSTRHDKKKYKPLRIYTTRTQNVGIQTLHEHIYDKILSCWHDTQR